MMEYKGYLGKVEFDPDENAFHGEVVNTRDVITFVGRSVEELREEMKTSIDDYLEFCASRGEEPDRPFSGKFMLRVDPSLHRDLATGAAESGKSLNAWVAMLLEHFVHDREKVRGAWLDEVQFRYGGHLFRCESRSGGVASVAPDGLARAASAFWWLCFDEREVRLFEADSDDTAELVIARAIDWFEQNVASDTNASGG